MKRFKDFIHDTNDILLAVIIVAIAAGVIFWRLNVILDYPEHLVQQSAGQTQSEEVRDDAEQADQAKG